MRVSAVEQLTRDNLRKQLACDIRTGGSYLNKISIRGHVWQTRLAVMALLGVEKSEIT